MRGRGLAMYLEWTRAIPTETVDIEVAADGTVTVFSDTQAMGQGLETSYTQLIVEILGITPAKVVIVQGDTDRANGVGSVGSRSAFVGGSAVVAAGRKTVARGTELAAEALETAVADIEYREGENPLANLKVLYGTGHVRVTADNKVVRTGGVRYTIKGGVVYDAAHLRDDVKRMVREAKQKAGRPALLQPGVAAPN